MSLRRTTFLWLAALITAIGIASIIASYVFVLSEADDSLDDQLRRLAIYVGNGEPQSTAPPPTSDEDNDPEDDFVVQVWNNANDEVRISDPAFPIPRQPRTGFTQATLSGQEWRVYTLRDAHRTVQISQEMTVRSEFANAAALQAAIPIALMVPLSWLLLNWIVLRITGRLDRLATAVGKRGPDDGASLPLDDVPAEIIPFVTAINALLLRLQQVLGKQRQFVSDAAHQLRTPLAALQIQIDSLDATGDARLAARVQELRGGVQRASALVTQLLRLARYDSDDHREAPAPFEVTALVLDCVSRIAPFARSRAIDLGITHRDDIVLSGSATDFAAAIDSLLDNAVRYTPAGGRIDIAIMRIETGIRIEIRDTGPGIDPDKLLRVFERFFRAAPSDIEGSGLGLAIAEAAARRNHATVILANRVDRPGLVARIDCPG